MDPFKQLAESILNEDVQEEGILDRAKVRAKTLGSRFGSSMAKLATKDKDKKQEYSNNYVTEITNSNRQVFSKKLNKAISDNVNDVGVLFKREFKKQGNDEDWSKFMEYLSYNKNLKIVSDKMTEVYFKYISEVLDKFNTDKKTPPPLPDQEQSVNQSTGDGDLSGTSADRAMSGP